MASTRELNIKPSCMTDMLAFPDGQVAQFLEKVQLLLKDPLPDGKVKKKLVGKKDLYRLRVGSFRVIYTFGDAWIRLLAIRKRDEQTYKGEMKADDPGWVPGAADDEDDADLLAVPLPAQFHFSPKVKATSLPEPINIELLKSIKVPTEHFAPLLSCTSEESLLAAAVPSDVLERVVDRLFPKPLDQVEQQPDFVVTELEDLVKYKGGELFGFLLRLDEDQQKLVSWALNGPTLIKGGAGTGKSTVALHRVRALLTRAGKPAGERILFTTYTRALTAVNRQLLAQLLDPAQLAQVKVSTVDELARAIVGSKKPSINLETNAMAVLRGVRAKHVPAGATALERKAKQQALARLSDRYLMDEFEWIIEGRGLSTVDEYLAAPRPGRSIALRPSGRQAVWDLHQAFLKAVSASGKETFSTVRSQALEAARSGAWKDRYDYVLVDEAQDLTPVSLALLAEVAAKPEGLFFAADEKQSLYSRNYTWTQAHPRLNFVGRTAVLKRNYRSTLEIDRAAFDVLVAEEGEPLTASHSMHSGPMPVLLRDVPAAKVAPAVSSFIRQMAQHLRMKLATAGVLVTTEAAGAQLAAQLVAAGLPAKFFKGRDLDLNADVVKVLTLHSAKGLEFPIVAVVGHDAGGYPQEGDYGDKGEFEEDVRNERRLLYVGLTRAMRGLLLVVPEGNKFEVFSGLNSDHWYAGAVS